MAGYSGTPLAKKLGIKPGANVLLINAPDGLEGSLDGLPADARVSRATTARGGGKAGRDGGGADVIVFFTKSRADFERRLASIAERLKQNGGLWIAWPKKASSVATDMTEDAIREVALPGGLVDNKVCAIDEVWSGLRLVIRVENRKS